MEHKCGTCHNADVVYKIKRSNEEWDRLVYGMKQRGLVLSELEESELMTQLYEKLGK